MRNRVRIWAGRPRKHRALGRLGLWNRFQAALTLGSMALSIALLGDLMIELLKTRTVRGGPTARAGQFLSARRRSVTWI